MIVFRRGSSPPVIGDAVEDDGEPVNLTEAETVRWIAARRFPATEAEAVLVKEPVLDPQITGRFTVELTPEDTRKFDLGGLSQRQFFCGLLLTYADGGERPVPDKGTPPIITVLRGFLDPIE